MLFLNNSHYNYFNAFDYRVEISLQKQVLTQFRLLYTILETFRGNLHNFKYQLCSNFCNE